MELESACERRRGWRDSAAVPCAVALGACAVLVSLAALTLILVRQQQQQQPPQDRVQPPSDLKQPSQSQTRAQLVLDGSSSITNKRLAWLTRDNVERVIFDHEFYDYDKDSDMLKIKSEGVYHICAQMAAKCYLKSKEQGNVNLIIHHKTAHSSAPILTLSVHLYPCLNESLSASMGVLFPLKENDSLHVTLTASTNSSTNSTVFLSWQLEKFDTIFSVSKMSGDSENSNVSSEDKRVLMNCR